MVVLEFDSGSVSSEDLLSSARLWKGESKESMEEFERGENTKSIFAEDIEEAD